jgi:iron complex outermembrane recepter protein
MVISKLRACGRTKAIIFASCLAQTAAPAAAAATYTMQVDEKPDQNTAPLEEIVVTAERRAENLQSVPISMSAISGTTLENFAVRNFFEYAVTVPNLTIGAGTGVGGNGSGFGVSSSRAVTIRGVAGNNTTGFYLNDTPIPLSLDPRVLDVDRIEVLRGPQGTLFGAGSMGGVVRMITREPALDQTSGKVQAEGFYVDHGGGGYSTSGILNVPLISRSVALRINVFSAFDPGLFTRVWGGPQSALSPSVPLPPDAPTGEKTHVGAIQQTGLVASLGIAPSSLPGFTLTPMFIYQRAISNGYPLADYNPSNFVQIRPLNVPEAVSDTWSFGGLTAKYDAGFGRFIGLGTYFYRNGFDLEDGTQFYATGGAGVGDYPYYVPAPLYNNLYTKTWSGEARFESQLHGPVQFVLGFFSSLSERFYTEYLNSPGANAATGGLLGSDVLYTQGSPAADRQRAEFLDVTYNVTSALQLSAGVRRAYLGHERTYVADGFLNGGPSHDFFGNHSENDTAPRYILKYQFMSDQMLYASAAKGFRIGGSNSLLGSVCEAALTIAGITNGAPFKSDSLWSYEVGTKNSWFGGRVKSRLSVFRIDWKNIQQTTSLAAVDPICGFNVTTNSGAAVSKGAEIEVDAAPLEHLTLNVAAGYDNAKITEATPGSLTVVGQPINEVPKWTGSATAQYSVPLSELSLFIRGQYTYSGSRTSFVNVLPPAGRPLNSYSLVNLRVGVDQGPWEAALFARNLFNAHAEIGDLAGENAELLGRPRWFIATPRTIGLWLRRAF